MQKERLKEMQNTERNAQIKCENKHRNGKKEVQK